MKTVKTPKGTELPLTNLKGKDYLMVAYRLIWLNEVVPNFEIDTCVLKMENDESVVRATVNLFNPDGTKYKSASCTKREDSKGFADHLEKAETGAVGRALALLGFGTQFALTDLDEGNRLADAPVQIPKKVAELSTNNPMSYEEALHAEPKSKSTFKSNKTTTPPTRKAPVTQAEPDAGTEVEDDTF